METQTIRLQWRPRNVVEGSDVAGRQPQKRKTDDRPVPRNRQTEVVQGWYSQQIKPRDDNSRQVVPENRASMGYGHQRHRMKNGVRESTCHTEQTMLIRTIHTPKRPCMKNDVNTDDADPPAESFKM